MSLDAFLSLLPNEVASEFDSIAADCQAAFFDFDYRKGNAQAALIVTAIWLSREVVKLRKEVAELRAKPLAGADLDELEVKP